MPIELVCSGCQSRLRVPDEAAGRQVRCPSCKALDPAPAAVVGEPISAAGRPADPTRDPLEHPSKAADHPFAADDGNPYRAPRDVSPEYAAGKPVGGPALASRWSRFGGCILDGLVHLPAMAPGIALMSLAGNEEGEVAGLFLMLAGALLVQIVNWVMITNNGQSVAKWMLGMRIVRFDDGALPGFVRGVLLRAWAPALINQLCSLFSLVDALFIFGEERRCIHDHLAGTIVIDVKTETQSPYTH